MSDATRPTWIDAAARSVVRLPDGRTARLVSVPIHRGDKDPRPGAPRRNRAGNKARVMLASGKYLSVAWDDLTLVSAEPGSLG